MYQFVAPLTEPVGLLWLIMAVISLVLLWRRQWRSAICLGLPAVALFILASTSLAEILVAAEERPWTRASQLAGGTPADAAVALGGGDRVSAHDLLGFAIADGGSRLLTALELVRSGRARTLVLGGSWPMPGKPEVPSIRVVQDWVNSWGLCPGSVTNLGICINTHDEAIAFAKLAQGRNWSNVTLVTSALHMRRSVALFKKQGIEVVPVAADFQVEGVSQDLPFSPFPRQHRLSLLALYMHEKIGWWVYRARGWV